MYHINPETGVVSRCRATVKCPFGGETGSENHFKTPAEARKGYEVIVSEKQRNFEKLDEALSAADEEFKISEKLHRDAITEYRSTGRGLKKIESLEKEKRRKTDKIRKAFHALHMQARELESMGLLSDYQKESIKDTSAYTRWHSNMMQTIRNRKTFDALEHTPTAIKEYYAWSGKTVDASKKTWDAYDPSKYSSRDQYMIERFQKDFDRKTTFTFIDLETTSFHPSSGEIIEIGVVKCDNKGRVIERYSKRYDIEDPKVRETIGVGATNIHKISPKDVAGLKTFRDPEEQKVLKRLLNDRDTVVVAHNANFEGVFLNQYLDGYESTHNIESAENLKNKTDPGRIMDTRNLSMFFLHDAPNSRLESFSEYNGVPYQDAHSADADAEMTAKAFFNFRDTILKSGKGERPHFQKIEKEKV